MSQPRHGRHALPDDEDAGPGPVADAAVAVSDGSDGSDGPGGSGAQREVPPPRPARGASVPPPRPRYSGPELPPLYEEPEPAPTSVTAAFWVLLAAGFAGVASAALAATRLDALRDRLRSSTAVADLDPAAVEDVVAAAVFGSLGATVALSVLVGVLAALARGGRGGARVALVLLGVLALPVLLVTRAVVTGAPRLGLVLALLLLIGGLVLLFVGGASAWFRAQRR